MQLLQGDCLELMKDLPDGCVDMVLCDLPYGTTRNKWDAVIPFGPLWEQYRRVIKENGAIVLFSDGRFTFSLVGSNLQDWKYTLVWDKGYPGGFLNANKMPLRQHEEIQVFYRKAPTYNPQKTPGAPSHAKGKAAGSGPAKVNNNYGSYQVVDNSKELGAMKHPISILRFPKVHPSKAIHPTQKPTDLCKFLVRTYTNIGDTVLDNCMGSGSTGVACIETERDFIGIEKDPKIFASARCRILDAAGDIFWRGKKEVDTWRKN